MTAEEYATRHALPFRTAARFRDHVGFVGTVEESTREDTDFFDCELVLADSRRIGARWYELEPVR